MSVPWSFVARAGLIGALVLAVLGARADEPGWHFEPSELAHPDAVMVFAGRLSTTDLASTLLFNTNYRETLGKPPYDNDVAGVGYERDLYELRNDLRLRAEAGLDERWGHYLVCCLQLRGGVYHADVTQRLEGDAYSTEIWGGAKLRWEDFRPVGDLRAALGFTLGLSGVTRTMGRERQREIDYDGDAHLLVYLAPELDLSLASLPELEWVIRVPHRSGVGGILGHMREGYNADVMGVRYAF